MLITREELIRFLRENEIPAPAQLLSTKPKLLLVDDDEDLIESLAKLFQQAGDFEIEIATSGFAAGSALERFKPDLILLDVMLGDLDGRELFARIKDAREHEHVKVIAVSGYIKDEEVPALLDLGFHDYVAKPFKFADLVDRIEAVMGIPLKA